MTVPEGSEGMAARGFRTALACYILSVTTLVTGVSIAAARYPGSFDWVYTVISGLASRKYNPEGSAWFAGALGLGLALLWPATVYLRRTEAPARERWQRGAIGVFRGGLVFGVLVGFERLVLFHFSASVRQGHEVLALLAFVGCYAGVLGLYGCRLRRRGGEGWAMALAAVPLVAIGVSQLALWFDQRDLGWVDQEWRTMGIPFWLSFAFWQWLGLAALWLAIGHLLLTAQRDGKRKA